MRRRKHDDRPSLPLFELAILKGLVEHGDGTAYFASLGAWLHYADLAILMGVVSRSGVVTWPDTMDSYIATDLGRAEYERLGLAGLPITEKFRSRAYTWDWSSVAERGGWRL